VKQLSLDQAKVESLKQGLGFSESDLRKNHHKTRREVFLAKMEAFISWARL